MKIAIIDDEKPARNELHFLIEEVVANAAIIEIESGEIALDLISKESFDLLCIDISLGDISGITLAAAARKMQPNVEIVFATAYNNHADKAYELDALYYLLKPFSEKNVRQMIQKYNQKHLTKPQIHSKAIITRIPLNIEKKIVLLNVTSIVYIEAQNRFCIIHTKEKDYKDSNPLSYYEEKLIDSGFFRIQKSYLINMKYVLELYPWFNNTYCVKMDGFKDVNLPVSRSQIKKIKQLFCI